VLQPYQSPPGRRAGSRGQSVRGPPELAAAAEFVGRDEEVRLLWEYLEAKEKRLDRGPEGERQVGLLTLVELQWRSRPNLQEVEASGYP